MKILWFTWKDLSHPWAGGAELVNERLAERLVEEGHEVTFLVGGYKNSISQELVNGYKVIRIGGYYSVFWQAYIYYRKNLSDWPDLIIEEINTVPFFTKFYTKQPSGLIIHQLCRKVWFYQLKLPVSLLGYIIEPIYMRLLKNTKVITISESSRNDLQQLGFKPDNISIMKLGIDHEPINKLNIEDKYPQPTLLSLGAIRPMKQTIDHIKGFELAKKDVPNLKLTIAGDCGGNYGKQVLDYIKMSRHKHDIEYLGKVSSPKRMDLMRRSHLILGTSVKEGWGLTITEAASQGTPAIVYDVDGLRDSTHYGTTGVITKANTPYALSEAIISIFKNKDSYVQLCKRALESSRHYNFEICFTDFKKYIAEISATKPKSKLVSGEELA
ncbi:MAG: glycosyltransferase family 4 protein [Candidatus Saccharimonadales bacterium]